MQVAKNNSYKMILSPTKVRNLLIAAGFEISENAEISIATIGGNISITWSVSSTADIKGPNLE